MKIGVTARFQNSYFSGSLPQVACSLACTFAQAGHDVTLLYPEGDPAWFIDVPSLAARMPPRKSNKTLDSYDIVLEVVWQLTPDQRKTHTKQTIYFAHYPAVFYDMESSVYQWNPLRRNFQNLSAIWTYNHFRKQDIRYLEFLSNVPVVQVPYVWNPDALDMFVKENNLPLWTDSAKRVEASINKELPVAASWNARIMESNFSNSSHCILPLSILSQIRISGDPIRFGIHNGEQLVKNEFFKANIVRNLLVPDISGNIVPRVRLPDLLREKTMFITHQRFRPLKTFLLDALYLGIPMIHNCVLLKSFSPYFYELNEIQSAVDAWKVLKTDYANSTGFFGSNAATVRRNALRQRFSVQSLSQEYNAILTRPLPLVKAIVPVQPQMPSNELRVAFCDMWDDFQPKYNFFMYLLAWAGAHNNIKVVNDQKNPNVVFFGPLSNGTEAKYPGVPKVYFTGENSPSNTHPDTFLNLGFSYTNVDNYIRLPLWILEINWFNADIEKLVNPKPVNLEDALRVKPELLDAKTKFCAFVATNPNNQNRNAAFTILNQWKHIDAGGRLFCNMPGGPIPAGRGGGGGELAKIDFYKDYKFALTYENSSSPGYTTEKLFHAKVAGAVPIYWGDPFIDRDFEAKGYINANRVSNAQELIQLVEKVMNDDAAWRAMASVPALTDFKRAWCQKTMEQVAKAIFKRVTNTDIVLDSAKWKEAQLFGAMYENEAIPLMAANNSKILATVPRPQTQPQLVAKIPSTTNTNRQFITACNAKYVEAAMNAVASFHKLEPNTRIIVYIYPDVTSDTYEMFKNMGATELRIMPTTEKSQTPWADFWDPQHFAWKLWVHQNALQDAPTDTLILYLDAGTVLTAQLDKVWAQIDRTGIFLLDDTEQQNRRWCHPEFCKTLKVTESELSTNQIWAGCVGFKKGHTYNHIHELALTIAKNHREAIVGEKWSAYSKECLGHRHDQSILSVLTQRASCPRLSLKEFYCDVSMRTAQQWGTPFYVHRGNYREMVPFADGIDEAYLINLPRRADRLEKFKSAHTNIKDRVYVWQAIDGRTLTLDQNIVHCFRNNDFNWKKSVMGCALSHLGLWEKLANDPLAKSYLIMEDDVRFSERWLVQWAQAYMSIPADADVIYLGGVLPPNKPALPHITDPVNKWFAKVKVNNMFGGDARRYFHFCNYSYVLTQAGARKLCLLVKERGIFTSGDHMIVNHGDKLLNIYFTTPLMSTCFQEDDPAYQKSEFNNFKRVDNFDSDLWNNTDCFSKEDVMACLSKDLEAQKFTVVGEPVVGEPAIQNVEKLQQQPQQSQQPPASISQEERIQIWNEFLREVALNRQENIPNLLNQIFHIWKLMTQDEFLKNFGWYRIFEQLIVTKNVLIVACTEQILSLIKTTFDTKSSPLFEKILTVLEGRTDKVSPAVTMYVGNNTEPQVVFHMKDINPKHMCELQWLDKIYDKSLVFRPLETTDELLQSTHPTLLYQKIPGTDISVFLNTVLDSVKAANKHIILLHLSDEFANDPISLYAHPAVKHVLRNYWRPDLKLHTGKVTVLPLGYTNGRHAANLPPASPFGKRDNIWSFAGAIDRQGRKEALDMLNSVKPNTVRSNPTFGADQLEGTDYIELLRNSKFVPCFRGSFALESYRLYEALEHGAIPIYVPGESNTTADELRELFGPHPFLGFPSWESASSLLPKFATQNDTMEKHRQSLMMWWSNKKAEVKASINNIYN